MSKGETPRRRGRPPLPPDSGKRYPLGVRTTPATRDRLQAAAKRSGRSIAQETEVLLERALAVAEEERAALDMANGRSLSGLLVLLGRVMGQVGTVRRLLSTEHKDPAPRTGWLSDPWAFDEAVQAANHAFERYRPVGDPSRMASGEAVTGWRGSGARFAEMVLDSLRDDGGTSAELEPVYERLGPPRRPALAVFPQGSPEWEALATAEEVAAWRAARGQQ